MKRYFAIFFVTLLLLIVTCYLQAQIPRTLSYQGVLTDNLGNPKPDATYSVTFRLYQTLSGGSAIWSDTKSLQTSRGLFSTILGDPTPFDESVKFDKPYWLSIQVGADPELSPRIPLTSVGYSMNSRWADTAKVGIMSVADTQWRTSGTDIYRSSGHVGIGTNTPSYHIDISGNQAVARLTSTANLNGSALLLKSGLVSANYLGTINFTTSTDNTPGQIGYLGTDAMTFRVSSIERMRIINNGYMGIGTASPQTRLDIKGGLRINDFTWPTTGEGLEFGYNSDNNEGIIQVYDRNASSWGKLFLGNGNVGIGTENPTKQLEVNGEVKAQTVQVTQNLGNDAIPEDGMLSRDNIIYAWGYVGAHGELGPHFGIKSAAELGTGTYKIIYDKKFETYAPIVTAVSDRNFIIQLDEAAMTDSSCQVRTYTEAITDGRGQGYCAFYFIIVGRPK